MTIKPIKQRAEKFAVFKKKYVEIEQLRDELKGALERRLEGGEAMNV